MRCILFCLPRPAPALPPLLPVAPNSRPQKVAWALGSINPADDWYRSAAYALGGFALLMTGLSYVSGHAGTTEGGEWHGLGLGGAHWMGSRRRAALYWLVQREW